MNHKYFVFTTPTNAVVQMRHDSGWNAIAVPGTHPSGRKGQVFDIPDTVPAGFGAILNLSAEGHNPLEFRGTLNYIDEKSAVFMTDDYHMIAVTTTAPPPATGGDPLEIIHGIYATGQYDLSTHDGCGLFTEAVCTALHDQVSELFGHFKKHPPQNMYNGHAVDALQCIGGEYMGGWDLIKNSVSPDAEPVFNYLGQPDPAIYCYPASDCAS